MAQACTICNHPQRDEIEKEALTPNSNKSEIGRKYGVGNDSIKYHIDNHLSPAIINQASLVERLQIDALLSEIENCLNRAKEIRDNPDYQAKPALILQAGREVRGIIGQMVSWGIEMQKMQLSQQNGREQVDREHGVIELPTITPDMSAIEAANLYKSYICSLKHFPGSSIVILPPKEPVEPTTPVINQEQETPLQDVQAHRETRRQAREARRLRLQQGDQPEMEVEPSEVDEEAEENKRLEQEINDILNWEPPPAPGRKPISINRRPD